MLVLNVKCVGCGCAQLVTESFCNVKKLDPKDYSYTCIANAESECLGKEAMYTREKEGGHK